MIKLSLKQLLRTPWKALLFFLLLTGCTLLLVLGSALLYQTERRIEAVESGFTTIGTVKQDPLAELVPTFHYDECVGKEVLSYHDVFDDPISVDVLDFEGADYVLPPENRPYYAAYLPDLKRSFVWPANSWYVEFTALEDLTEKYHPVPIRIEKVLDPKAEDGFTAEDKEVLLCECFDGEAIPLTAGKRYVANLASDYCETHQVMEYRPRRAPICVQYSADGTQLVAPEDAVLRVDEVTEGYWTEGGKGQAWYREMDYADRAACLYLAVPTNGLQLIPAFHRRQAKIVQGREITEEEFSGGALVCLAAEPLLKNGGLHLGDTVSMSLLYSYHCSVEDAAQYDLFTQPVRNAAGEEYRPFWQAEYEIVGTYEAADGDAVSYGKFARNAFIIPSKSVLASDENNIVGFAPMSPWQTGFQIENGAVEEFDTALRENVPEAARLTITYEDNGYAELMTSLQSIRVTAILLFGAGVLACVAVIVLLLYFFVVRQKKRTAIERGLGKTKRQCCVSLLAGVLALSLCAVTVGSVCGGLLLRPRESAAVTVEDWHSENREYAVKIGSFSTKFSLWAHDSQLKAEDIEAEIPAALYFLPAGGVLLLITGLGYFLVRRNLQTEPILLLSGKGDE